jgi:hypothetical protein
LSEQRPQRNFKGRSVEIKFVKSRFGRNRIEKEGVVAINTQHKSFLD